MAADSLMHRLNVPFPGTVWWVYGATVGAVGTILMGLGGLVPDWASIVISNLAIAYGYAFVWAGMARHFNRRVRWNLVFGLPFVSVFPVIWFTYVDPSVGIRTIMMTVLVGGISLAAARELFLGHAKLGGMAARFMAYLFMINSLALFSRIPPALVWMPTESYLATGIGTMVLFGWTIVFSICYVAGMLLMISDRLNTDLTSLTEILPICSNCRKIRNDEGSWNQLEMYLMDRKNIAFSHGICPECRKTLYPELGGPSEEVMT